MAICQFCGAEFAPKRYTKGLYCSRSCRGKAAFAAPETHPRWKGGPEPMTCANCGAEFLRERGARAPKSGNAYCSPACHYAHAKGPNSPHWKGGRVVDAEGYVRVYRPDHPNAFASGYVYEHVVVASETLGRPLAAGEVVHHRDERRTNNEPANLEVHSGHSDHMKLHHEIRRTRQTK